jgi:Fe-S-cluster containining protein
MENFNKHAPCLDKNCSFCCDPVKINQRAAQSGFKSPSDKSGNKIWKETGEVLTPIEKIDTDRVITFECVNLDKESGKCLDYENRPEICSNTTCIRNESEDVDSQHRRMTEIKFVKIK